MPFRERVKRALGRSTSNSETSSLHKQDSRKNSNSNSANNNNNIYQPGEAMPKAKYRQPVDKKHKEHLESFNFMSNFTDALSRRKSQASQYSPMGSRLSSRNNSLTHPGAGAAAMGMAPPKLGRGQSYIEQVVENADDDTDPVNVGGASRRQSFIANPHSRGPSRRHSRDMLMRPSNLQSGTHTPGYYSTQRSTPAPTPHRDFTEAEIAEALKKLNMRVAGGKENVSPR